MSKDKRLRDKIGFILCIFTGVFATIGGWWTMLSFFGFKPAFPGPYTMLNLIIALMMLVTLWTYLIIMGPHFIYDSIKGYREKGSE